MDRFAVDQGLKDLVTNLSPQPQAAQLPTCFELSFADAGETLATIATLIDAGLAMPETLEPRLCERCGAYHARRAQR